MATNQSLAFPQRVTFWQIVDEIVGTGGHEDDGDERRAQDAVRSGHVLKRRTDDMSYSYMYSMVRLLRPFVGQAWHPT